MPAIALSDLPIPIPAPIHTHQTPSCTKSKPKLILCPDSCCAVPSAVRLSVSDMSLDWIGLDGNYSSFLRMMKITLSLSLSLRNSCTVHFTISWQHTHSRPLTSRMFHSVTDFRSVTVEWKFNFHHHFSFQKTVSIVQRNIYSKGEEVERSIDITNLLVV